MAETEKNKKTKSKNSKKGKITVLLDIDAWQILKDVQELEEKASLSASIRALKKETLELQQTVTLLRAR